MVEKEFIKRGSYAIVDLIDTLLLRQYLTRVLETEQPILVEKDSFNKIKLTIVEVK